jgi:opacity protein-like surface antigen
MRSARRAARTAGMDVMKLKLAALLVGILAAATGSAQAQNLAYGAGLKERIEIPAPIPEHGAIAVPAGVPVPEGFTYYLRGDLGWGFAGERSYSENGRTYGAGPGPFTSTTGSFTFGSPDFTSSSFTNDDVFAGTIGFGAYFTRHLRGDLTLDFRGKQNLDHNSAYSYESTIAPGNTVNGTVRDRFQMRSVVGLANLYFDLLPRGAFTPYVGAGVGFVYNDVTRSYSNSENEVDGLGAIVTSGTPVSGSSKEKGVGLAGALMAGASFAVSHSWMIDVNYRALYLGSVDVVTPVNTLVPSNTRAQLGDTWEHQVRVGLRFNIW